MTRVSKNVSNLVNAAVFLVDGVSVLALYTSWFLLLWAPIVFVVVMFILDQPTSENILFFGITWIVLVLIGFLARWFARGFIERKRIRLALGGIISISLGAVAILAGFLVLGDIDENAQGVRATIGQGLIFVIVGIALIVTTFSKNAREK